MSEDSVRVIVVDDVPDAAQTLALLLELDGYDVRMAHDGAQALAMIDSFAPHCILFDIDMPGVDGFELSKRVRERHVDDIVLIAVTARENQDPRVVGAFTVADHYVRKPVDHAVLRRVLPPLAGNSGARA
jgi:DNA-binding response OmpR family regulator